MSDIREHLPAWVEHLEDVAAAEAELARLEPIAAAVAAEHNARVSEHREAVRDALDAGQVPPLPPPPMPLDAHRAVARARDVLVAVKGQGTAVLASAVDDLEALVRDRASERDREARSLVERLQTLAADQRADSRTLAGARHAADPTRRPSGHDRTHVPRDVHDYVKGLTRGVSWAALIPLEALGIAPPEPVQPEPSAWHASRARGPLEGPEYAQVRAADRRAAAGRGRDSRL